MAVAFVQDAAGSSGSASTTATATFGSATTSGNLLVLCMAGDKDTGSVTASGWTPLFSLTSTSVSLYYLWKTSSGESSVTVTWSASSVGGNMLWVGEYADTAATGAWSVVGSASHLTDETTAVNWATGTTSATTAAGLAIAAAAVDSSQNVTTVSAWGNSYTARYSGTGGAGRGGVFVAESTVASGVTTSSTFSYTGTADQLSAAVAVFSRAGSGGGGGGGTSGSGGYGAAVKLLNPELYLALDETSGTAAADSSGNGHAGVYSGGYTLGQVSGNADLKTAVKFVASTSGQVAVPSASALNLPTGSGTAWSVVFRLRADTGTASTFPGIIGKGTTSTGWGVFRDGGTGAVGFKIMGTQVVTGTGAVVVGTWAHWAITNDGANIRFYKDGTLLTTAALSTAHAPAITTDFVVNKADSYGDNTLDEISIHLTTLSATQISSLVTAQSTPAGVAKTLTGAITAAAGIVRGPAKKSVGSATPAGSYFRTFPARIVAGSVTASGVKFGRLSRSLFGAVFTTGFAQRGYPRNVSGSLTGAGVVAKRSAGRFFFATITAAGTAKRSVNRPIIGIVAPSGAAVKSPRMFRVGSVTGFGVPNQIGVRLRSFVGSLTPAGTVKRIPGKRPAGTVSPTGPTLRRAVTKRGSASIPVVGGLLAGLFRRVFGPAGTCIVTVAPAAEVSMSLFLRHRAQLVVEVTTRGAGPQVRAASLSMTSASVLLPAMRQTAVAAMAAVSASDFTATATSSSPTYGFGYTGGGY